MKTSSRSQAVKRNKEVPSLNIGLRDELKVDVPRDPDALKARAEMLEAFASARRKFGRLAEEGAPLPKDLVDQNTSMKPQEQPKSVFLGSFPRRKK